MESQLPLHERQALSNKELYEHAKVHKETDPSLVKRLLAYGRLRKKSNAMKGDRYEQMFDLNDPNIVVLLPDKWNHRLLKFLPKQMQENRDVVLAFVKVTPDAIRYASVEFLDDKEIMLEVIKTYWGIYTAVSERLMNDEEVLKAVMMKKR